jgi:hypothetical protein
MELSFSSLPVSPVPFNSAAQADARGSMALCNGQPARAAGCGR